MTQGHPLLSRAVETLPFAAGTDNRSRSLATRTSAPAHAMKRSLATGAALLALGLLALVLVQRQRPASSPLAPAPAHNPGGFVASDVARLASTGKPQLVEIFHYG